MKSDKKNKIKKQDLILFLSVFVFSMIVNNAFLQRHYSSDAMCLIDLGYFEYPLKFFLLDGRIISTLVCYIGGMLQLPYDVYLFISNFIGIILLALSTTILFKFIVNYLKIENKWIKFMVLLSTYTIIFNHMDIEYMLFPESCVMCAGLLFSVIASIKYLEEKKGRTYKSFIFLLISTLCYQGLISIFPTIVITLSLLKKRNCNKRELSKFYIKEVFKVGIMFVIAMAISAGIIHLFNNILDSSSYRLERIEKIFRVLKLFPNIILGILIDQTNRMPFLLGALVMVITGIITIKNDNLTYRYILTMFTAYMFSVLPVLVFCYVKPRLLMSIGAAMGISLLFIAKAIKDEKKTISVKNVETVVISICVISYFMFNVINNYIMGYEHLKAFAIDEEIGKRISEIVTEYENSSEKEITKFAYYLDTNVQTYERGIKRLGSLTERKLAMQHSILQTINYYCNKKLEEVEFSYKVYYENFYNKNYTEFSEEQLMFIDDTLYMYVY